MPVFFELSLSSHLRCACIPCLLPVMAAAMEIANDRVHPELDEKRISSSPSHSGPSAYVVSEGTPHTELALPSVLIFFGLILFAGTNLPPLSVLMQFAELARAREAGLGPGESFTPSANADQKTIESKENGIVSSGPPDIDEDLINARRALRTARCVFHLSNAKSRY